MSRMRFYPLSMESIPFSQLADLLHLETQDAILEKTTLIAVRTRGGDLQLGLGAGLEERKDAVTRLFHIDRC
jgi:hypothetical protein